MSNISHDRPLFRHLSLVVAVLVAASITIVPKGALGAEPITIKVCPTDCDHTTIQSAIDSASEGATIEVSAGEYDESVTIDKSLILLGPNADTSPNSADPLTLNPDRQSAAVIVPDLQETAFTISTDEDTANVDVRGFDVQLHEESEEHFVEFVEYGVVGTESLRLENNIFSGGDEARRGSFSLRLNSQSPSFFFSNNRLSSGPFSNGVWLRVDEPIDITVTDNVWINNPGWAMNINGPGGKSGVIEGNWVGNSEEWLEDDGSDGGRDQWGFLLQRKFDDLKLIDNTFTNMRYSAISLYSEDEEKLRFRGALAITGNTFSGYQREDGFGAIHGRNSGAENVVPDFSEVVIENNCFGEDVVPAVSNDSGEPLAVRDNWWGQASGPGQEQIVEGETEGSDVIVEAWNQTNTCVTPEPTEAGSESPEDSAPSPSTLQPEPSLSDPDAPRRDLVADLESLNARVSELPLPSGVSAPEQADRAIAVVGDGAPAIEIASLVDDELSPSLPLIANSALVGFDQDQGALSLPFGDSAEVNVQFPDVRVWVVGQISVALAFVDSEGNVAPQNDGEAGKFNAKDSLLMVVNGLPPGANVRLIGFSEPTDLGVFQADQRGELVIQEALAERLEPGNHTLRVVAPNRDGQLVTVDIPIEAQPTQEASVPTEAEENAATEETEESEGEQPQPVTPVDADMAPWVVGTIIGGLVFAVLIVTVALINSRTRAKS